MLLYAEAVLRTHPLECRIGMYEYVGCGSRYGMC